MLLMVENLNKRFGGPVAAHVLRDVSFEMAAGELTALVGPSGAGKTTCLNIISTLDSPTSGQVLIDGVNVHQLNQRDLNHFRNHRLGFVFQDDLLLSHLSALENVMLPGRIARLEGRGLRDRARALLERVGLGDRMRNLPGQLSGGQRQRVNLARALINEPMLLLADEPTARLDRSTGQGIVQLLVELYEQLGVTILMVTHEHELAERCGRIIEFVDGAIIADRRFEPEPVAPADDAEDVPPLRRTLTRLGYSLGAAERSP